MEFEKEGVEMKAHKLDMIAAWAAENGIKGFEHLDPKVRQKRRMDAITRSNQRERDVDHKSQKKYNRE
jgi:hypothetical protein